ncbi:MAG TPA: malectin [Verrucomicrobiae bacterium]
MKNQNSLNPTLGHGLLALTASLLLAGCAATPSADAPHAAAAAPAAAAVAPVQTQPVAIRIKAGNTELFKDAAGHEWLADTGFADGDTTDRPDLQIGNTTEPKLYWSERYSMTKFTRDLPNGNYLVKLHFCETFDGITAPGQRVFSFNVAGHEFKDFDVWAKAGGPLKAYVETVPVTITGGKLEITFTPNVENPQINALEILPVTP